MQRRIWLAAAFALGGIAVAVSAFLRLDGWLTWVSCGFGLILLSLAVTDMHSLLLPDVLTLPLVPAGFIVAYATAPYSLPDHLIGSVGGFAAFAMIRVAHGWVRSCEGLGFGDVKLMAGIGAWTAWQGLPSVVLIASLAGLGAALFASVMHRNAWSEPLPFGAYLALGAWLVWLYGPLAIA